MMKKYISIASKSDLTALINLLNQLFTQDIEFVPDFEKQKRGLELIINDNRIGEILVLKIDEKIVGMVSLLYSISTALGGKVAIVEDMIIDQEYRNNGFGRALFSRAIDYSKENGCLRLTLLTDFDNHGAIKFYESFGFTKSEMIPLRFIH